MFSSWLETPYTSFVTAYNYLFASTLPSTQDIIDLLLEDGMVELELEDHSLLRICLDGRSKPSEPEEPSRYPNYDKLVKELFPQPEQPKPKQDQWVLNFYIERNGKEKHIRSLRESSKLSREKMFEYLEEKLEASRDKLRAVNPESDYKSVAVGATLFVAATSIASFHRDPFFAKQDYVPPTCPNPAAKNYPQHNQVAFPINQVCSPFDLSQFHVPASNTVFFNPGVSHFYNFEPLLTISRPPSRDPGDMVSRQYISWISGLRPGNFMTHINIKARNFYNPEIIIENLEQFSQSAYEIVSDTWEKIPGAEIASSILTELPHYLPSALELPKTIEPLKQLSSFAASTEQYVRQVFKPKQVSQRLLDLSILLPVLYPDSPMAWWGAWMSIASKVSLVGASPTSVPTSMPSASMLCGVDGSFLLNDLDAERGKIFHGEYSIGRSGTAVSTTSNFTGSDEKVVAIGANLEDPDSRVNAGIVYVSFLNSGETLDVNLTSLANSTGFQIWGAQDNDEFGGAVKFIGDLNGDGYPELVLGALRSTSNGQASAGKVAVIYGGPHLRNIAVLDLRDLTSDLGFFIQGEQSSDLVGYAVDGGLGIDFDDNGYDDLLFSAAGLSSTGAVIIFYGGPSIPLMTNVTDIVSQGKGVVIYGVYSVGRFGHSIGVARNFNGNPYPSILVGERFADPNSKNDAGAAYFFDGSPLFSTSREVYASALNGTNGFMIPGHSAGVEAGAAVTVLEGFYKRGQSTLAIGARRSSYGGKSEVGAVYLIHTPDVVDASGVLDVEKLTGPDGSILIGVDAGDLTGSSLSDGGDIDGDGYPDALFGCVGANSYTGKTLVLYGGAKFFVNATVFLENLLDGISGFEIVDGAAGRYSGNAVAGNIDLNGDMRADIVIGANRAIANGKTQAGKTYFVYCASEQLRPEPTSQPSGQPTSMPSRRPSGQPSSFPSISLREIGRSFSLSQFSAYDGIAIGGLGESDYYVGWSVAALANQGRKAKILVGAYQIGGGSGRLGTTFALSEQGQNITLSSLTQEQGLAFTSVDFDYIGRDVASLSDLDGDGEAELGVSAWGYPNSNKQGRVFVIRSNVTSDLYLPDVGSSQGFLISGEQADDEFGQTLSSVGNFTGTGQQAFAIGARGYPGGLGLGKACIFYPSKFSNIPLGNLTKNDGVCYTGENAADLVGGSVAGIGDVNLDGYDDVAIGGRCGVHVVFGGSYNTSEVPLVNLTESQGFFMQAFCRSTNINGVRIQYQVSSAGNFFGTSTPALMVSTPQSKGVVFVLDSSVNLNNVDLWQTTLSHGIRITGLNVNDFAGYSVALLGDVNGDQIDDIGVGAPGYPSGTYDGLACVIYGGQPRENLVIPNIDETQGYCVYGIGGQFGFSLSGNFDFNNDGRKDWVATAPSYVSGNDRGLVYIFYGGINSPTSQPSGQPTGQPTRRPSGEPSGQPTGEPSGQPTCMPSGQPTSGPSRRPSGQPTSEPSVVPSGEPSGQPTKVPSGQPTSGPTRRPSGQPTSEPSVVPSGEPSGQPTCMPSGQPTSEPSRRPSGQPTSEPSVVPSGEPSGQPTKVPSGQPTSVPSRRPSSQPTGQPSEVPSGQPTKVPSGQPTSGPSRRPSGQPTSEPSVVPSGEPSGQPSVGPSSQPTCVPSGQPTSGPTRRPSGQPTSEPSVVPSGEPTTVPSTAPSGQPTSVPSRRPSGQPSSEPSVVPSGEPSGQPTTVPSGQPTSGPSRRPSGQPTSEPSVVPSGEPSGQPTKVPSGQPTSGPSRRPSGQPTSEPSVVPSGEPSGQPTKVPSGQPTSGPSRRPSGQPSSEPSVVPSGEPSGQPTSVPSGQPTSGPTRRPSGQPTSEPSVVPSGEPSGQPTTVPSGQPTAVPSRRPSGQPTSKPSVVPSGEPSGQPSPVPSGQPTSGPTRRPSSQPTSEPSRRPSGEPTGVPSGQPTSGPTRRPSGEPTGVPSGQPTSGPSRRPTGEPTGQPTCVPSVVPSGEPSGQPTTVPSGQPTSVPSRRPSGEPTGVPSGEPTVVPSGQPTSEPSRRPSGEPTEVPSGEPTVVPSGEPSGQPTCVPSGQPTSVPSRRPSGQPTSVPSVLPSGEPSGQPTKVPSGQPTSGPTRRPSGQPTSEPSVVPSGKPSGQPTTVPSGQPTSGPSRRPSGQPTSEPSLVPSGEPSGQPSVGPSSQPTKVPSGQPTSGPSRRPSGQPTSEPSCSPTGEPTVQPSGQPTSRPSRRPSERPTNSPSGQPTSVPTSIQMGYVNSVIVPYPFYAYRTLMFAGKLYTVGAQWNYNLRHFQPVIQFSDNCASDITVLTATTGVSTYSIFESVVVVDPFGPEAYLKVAGGGFDMTYNVAWTMRLPLNGNATVLRSNERRFGSYAWLNDITAVNGDSTASVGQFISNDDNRHHILFLVEDSVDTLDVAKGYHIEGSTCKGVAITEIPRGILLAATASGSVGSGLVLLLDPEGGLVIPAQSIPDVALGFMKRSNANGFVTGGETSVVTEGNDIIEERQGLVAVGGGDGLITYLFTLKVPELVPVIAKSAVQTPDGRFVVALEVGYESKVYIAEVRIINNVPTLLSVGITGDENADDFVTDIIMSPHDPVNSVMFSGYSETLLAQDPDDFSQRRDTPYIVNMAGLKLPLFEYYTGFNTNLTEVMTLENLDLSIITRPVIQSEDLDKTQQANPLNPVLTDDTNNRRKFEAYATSTCQVAQVTPAPTNAPSGQPTSNPTRRPTTKPSSVPSVAPSGQPSGQPTSKPTRMPVTPRPTVLGETNPPTFVPTTATPSGQPTSNPSGRPSKQPSSGPSSAPSSVPSGSPSGQPTCNPTRRPTISHPPSPVPSEAPSKQPTVNPTRRPTARPSLRGNTEDDPQVSSAGLDPVYIVFIILCGLICLGCFGLSYKSIIRLLLSCCGFQSEEKKSIAFMKQLEREISQKNNQVVPYDPLADQERIGNRDKQLRRVLVKRLYPELVRAMNIWVEYCDDQLTLEYGKQQFEILCMAEEELASYDIERSVSARIENRMRKLGVYQFLYDGQHKVSPSRSKIMTIYDPRNGIGEKYMPFYQAARERWLSGHKQGVRKLSNDSAEGSHNATASMTNSSPKEGSPHNSARNSGSEKSVQQGAILIPDSQQVLTQESLNQSKLSASLQSLDGSSDVVVHYNNSDEEQKSSDNESWSIDWENLSIPSYESRRHSVVSFEDDSSSESEGESEVDDAEIVQSLKAKGVKHSDSSDESGSDDSHSDDSSDDSQRDKTEIDAKQPLFIKASDHPVEHLLSFKNQVSKRTDSHQATLIEPSVIESCVDELGKQGVSELDLVRTQPYVSEEGFVDPKDLSRFIEFVEQCQEDIALYGDLSEDEQSYEEDGDDDKVIISERYDPGIRKAESVGQQSQKEDEFGSVLDDYLSRATSSNKQNNAVIVRKNGLFGGVSIQKQLPPEQQKLAEDKSDVLYRITSGRSSALFSGSVSLLPSSSFNLTQRQEKKSSKAKGKSSGLYDGSASTVRLSKKHNKINPDVTHR